MKNQQFWRMPLSSRDVKEAARDWGLSAWMAEFLLRRGLTPEDLESGQAMSDPEELPDMKRAAAVVRDALDGGEKVRVHGDYDADGVTATAVLVRGLTLMGYGSQVDYYIPNRFDEGYGLGEEAVVEARSQGVELMVTVDCGSSSPDAAQCARELGLKLVITDHHALPERLPAAEALVNPERKPGTDRLSGAGVALQLVRALMGEDVPDILYGIAAVGTVADVVPMLGSNRALVSRGLDAIRRGRVPGVAELFHKNGRDLERARAQDLAFLVGPHLNAAGRMGAADTAVGLLLADRPDQLETYALSLVELNRERRQTEARMIEEAWQHLPRDASGRLYPFTVLAGDDWHQGVIGIVASRFRQWLRRPVAVIAWDGHEGKGSARSVPGFNLIEHLRGSADLFSKLGGHPGAAGFSLPRLDPDDISKILSNGLSEAVTAQQRQADPYDLVFDNQVSIQELADGLGRLEPFGREFDPPRFLVRGRVAQARLLGADGQHVSFSVKGQRIRAIGFGMGPQAATMEPDDPVRFIAELEPNWYRGALSYQWRVLQMDAPEPRRTVRPIRGKPNPLPRRIVWVAGSDRAARTQASIRGVAAFDQALPLGELAAVEEQARRGIIDEVAVSQWRPWPRLWEWADAVIWLCPPRSRAKLEQSARLARDGGRVWLAVPNALGIPSAKARRLALTRERMGRHWKTWQDGRAGLVPGRAVFDELELSPALAQRGERRSLADSYLYQRAQWEWEQDQDVSWWSLISGEEEMHGLD